MRCDEVVRELAAPTANRDREAMAEHLSSCSSCAEWARRAEQLDRLWEATRPAELSPEVWDAVWAQIAPSLPCPATARHEDAPMAGATPSRNGSGPRIFAHPAPAPASAPAPVGTRSRGRPWRLVSAVALVGLAQAAAILVALGLAWQSHPLRPGPGRNGGPVIAGPPAPAAPVPVRVATVVRFEAEIPEGSLKPKIRLLRVEGPTARVEDVTTPEMNTGSDIGMVWLNLMESAATPQVAAQ
jgi:hypothetical protein